MTGYSRTTGSLLLRSMQQEKPRNIGADVTIWLIWCVIVGYQAANHVMWRDEVRALTIALSGNDTLAMLRALHGEGHPALWYLLLRGAHTLWNSVLVLPVLAGLIAAASVALLIFRSPFPRWIVILLIGGHAFLYAYSVEARNYGISALVMFVIAMSYKTARHRGLLLGALLFILANTNLIAALMVGAFLLFWLTDIIEDTGLRWSPGLVHFGLNAALATLGVAVCAVTILPTYNDAAVHDWSTGSPVLTMLHALVDPGSFAPGKVFGTIFPSFIATILVFSLPLGLLQRRAACLGALAGLMLLSLFSSVASPGAYRHAAIWLCFCIMLYWIAWQDLKAVRAGMVHKIASDVGRAGFVVVFAIQLGAGLLHLAIPLIAGVPAGRSADLARLIAARPDLADAVIVSDPDYLVEPLPYYLANRLYLMRADRFGSVVRFSRTGRLGVDLGDLLTTSRAVQEETRSPIVILLAHHLSDVVPGRLIKEGYNWTFSASEAQIHEFLSSVEQIASYQQAETDESYDVYVLKPVFAMASGPTGPAAGKTTGIDQAKQAHVQ